MVDINLSPDLVGAGRDGLDVEVEVGVVILVLVAAVLGRHFFLHLVQVELLAVVILFLELLFLLQDFGSVIVTELETHWKIGHERVQVEDGD